VLTERRKYALAFRSQVIPARAGEIIRDLGNTIAECATPTGSMDALERADRESDLADWLEAAGVSTELSSELSAAGIVPDQLQPLAGLLPSETMEPGLRILVADHEILCLARELEEASRRVADLVHAVKTYSYMDQSPTTEVEVEEGIDATLRMFQYQLKHGVQVSKEFAANLPRIHANGSALNQVWTNLIDNAIDAMANNPPDRPKILTVRTSTEPGAIVVEIGDNGAGIPTDVQNRMFEPFFTTKSVGEGTGLGLDIVQRIVRSHRGAIRVESEPGRTMFQVHLPLDRR
jgi:signal transduction histidine kinase